MSETPETSEPIEEEKPSDESKTEVTESADSETPLQEQPASESSSEPLSEEPTDETETSEPPQPVEAGIRSDESETEVTESADSETPVEKQPASESGSEPLSEEQIDELENVDFPEASFDMLLMQHHTQAMLAMGMIPDPASGQVIKNKSAAKFHIDMLGIIQERTKGNLNQGEEEALNGVLHNLRMMFVEINK